MASPSDTSSDKGILPVWKKIRLDLITERDQSPPCWAPGVPGTRRGGNRMAWTTPMLVEICIGLEINGYLPAEL